MYVFEPCHYFYMAKLTIPNEIIKFANNYCNISISDAKQTS